MITIDLTNVMDIFQKLSHCTDEETAENLPILQDEIFRMENLLDENKYIASYKTQCEYAAAVCAFYDYLCKEYSKEKAVISQTGKIISAEDFSDRLVFAKELKKNALESIGFVLKDNEFLFSVI